MEVCVSVFIFFLSFLLFISERSNTGWPTTHYIIKNDLEAPDPDSQVLGLQANLPCLPVFFFLPFFLSVYGPRDQTQNLAQVWWAHMLQLSYTSSALMSKVIK